MTKETEEQQRYLKKRRRKCLSFLGNKCIRCGALDNLEFDHIYREIKEFDISQGIAKHLKWEKLVKELMKCQLLCKNCHNLKTIKDLGNKVAKGTHGNLSAYTYCRCEKCKLAKKEWSEEYYKTHKRVTVNGKRVVIKIGRLVQQQNASPTQKMSKVQVLDGPHN